MEYKSLWSSLGTFWNRAENKEIIEEIWDAIVGTYKYWNTYGQSLLNAVAGRDIKGAISADIYPLEIPNDATTDMDAYPILSAGALKGVGQDKVVHIYTAGTDFSIGHGKIHFMNPMAAGLYIAEAVILDVSRALYSLYKNIFSYYPVNYNSDTEYTPEQYAYALRAMLYTWRYGYTINNLQTSLAAIYGAPYTMWGGVIHSLTDKEAYVYNEIYEKRERIPSNGFTWSVSAGDSVRPMELLCAPPILVTPYLDNISQYSEVLKQTTLAVNFTGGLVKTTEAEDKFMVNYLDAVLPRKYSYKIPANQMPVAEEGIVVG